MKKVKEFIKIIFLLSCQIRIMARSSPFSYLNTPKFISPSQMKLKTSQSELKRVNLRRGELRKIRVKSNNSFKKVSACYHLLN